jgi:predicted regulator of Ras-like GTPase activity (Roadblock/LC7/MglB family)
MGADGLSVIGYYDVTNGDLKVAHCGNTSCSAGNTFTAVDSAVDVGVDRTSITLGTDGLPVISYLDNTNDDLKVAHCGNTSCSAGNTLTTVDSAGAFGFFSSMTLGTDGLPVISYKDNTNGDLKVAHCGNTSCSAGNTFTVVDSAGNVGIQSSITVGTDGLPVISYYDATNGDLKVAHCSNRFCMPFHRQR